MSTEMGYDHEESQYTRETPRYDSRSRSANKAKPAQARRRGKSPQSINGIHRRRKRKMNW